MIAPSGGLFPAGNSGGNGVSGLRFQRKRIAVPGANRCALALAISALHCRSGVMSSKIQNERPCVRSEEHTSELQSRFDLVCRLLLEKKKTRPSTGGPGRSPTSRLRPTSHRSRRALL